jgi:hypothetical protein
MLKARLFLPELEIFNALEIYGKETRERERSTLRRFIPRLINIQRAWRKRNNPKLYSREEIGSFLKI